MKVKTTLLGFNDYVVRERHSAKKADILLMSFNTFDEIDLLLETDGSAKSRIKKIAQLSYDDDCTVFCAARTVTAEHKNLSVLTCHKGKLYDITDRSINLTNDCYGTGDKLKIYETPYGKAAVLIGSDASLYFLWKKLTLSDFVFCFTLDDSLINDITRLSASTNLPAVVVSTSSSVLIKR